MKLNYTVTFKERFGFYKRPQKFEALGDKTIGGIITFFGVGEHDAEVNMIYSGIDEIEKV